MKNNYYIVLLGVCLIFSLFSCTKQSDPVTEQNPNGPNYGYAEPVPDTVVFNELEAFYSGDDIGEGSSDGWVLRLNTRMEKDDDGNFIGGGYYLQLSLNVPFAQDQLPHLSNLEGVYLSQSNSGDFSAGTFIYGYMDMVDLPSGREEQPVGTYYGELVDGSIEMEVDLMDDGIVRISVDPNSGICKIEGLLVGKKCLKRYFVWEGIVEVGYEQPQDDSNSTLDGDLDLSHLTHGFIQDKGDSFYLQDESYRTYLIFLGEDGVEFSTGRPAGSGDVLRLEILVPWESIVAEGIPEGDYPMVTRNENTSIDRDLIIPFVSIPGLPDSFSYPYWSGTWYVEFENGEWGDNFARITRGSVAVSKDSSGNFMINCDFKDSSTPSHNITGTVVLNSDNLIVSQY